MEGRLEIAAEIGLPFSDAELRRAIRGWDFHDHWGQWLSAGRISNSLDDLPHLAGDFAVTPEQIAAFDRDGYVILRGVATREEIMHYRPVIRDAVASYNVETASAIAHVQDRAFLQVINLRVRNQALRRFVLCPALPGSRPSCWV